MVSSHSAPVCRSCLRSFRFAARASASAPASTSARLPLLQPRWGAMEGGLRAGASMDMRRVVRSANAAGLGGSSRRFASSASSASSSSTSPATSTATSTATSSEAASSSSSTGPATTTTTTTTTASSPSNTNANHPVDAAARMRKSAPPNVEPELARQATEILFKECAAQADYYMPSAFNNTETVKTATGEELGEGSGWWYDALGLQPTFNTWAQVTFLHMWLLTVRLRCFPEAYAKIWMQMFHDHFFFEAEHRMVLFHGMSGKGMRNRYLKEMYNQWRGVLGAYDEGLIKGDAVMAAAVWRNVFKASEDVDWRHVAMIVGFVRRALAGLDKADDNVLVGASVRFGTPASENALVARQSGGLGKSFTELDKGFEAKFLKGEMELDGKDEVSL